MTPTTDSPKSKPHPGFFLVRPSGAVVPLIAVDELPPTLTLPSVPRSLDLEDTIGMLNLGLNRGSGAGVYYQVVATKSEESGKKVDLSVRAKTQEEKEKPAFKPLTPTAMKSMPARQTSTTAAPSPRGDTQLCRHWCTHGICKWGQQCRYRHIMPMTHAGLAEIGLSDWPLWYRGLNPGYFAGEHATRRRGRGCFSTGAGITGGCCGASQGMHGCVGAGHGRGRAGGPSGRRVVEGEKVLERLREIKDGGKGRDVGKGMSAGEKGAGGSPSQVKEKKEKLAWEDDDTDVGSDDSESVEAEKKGKSGKDKLVDV